VKRNVLAIGVTIALLSLATQAQAETYPSRAVRLVVPAPAGGGIDVMARTLSNKLSELLGQPVVIENKPGNVNNLGADVVSRASPDGYTVLIANNSMSISAGLYKSLSFDPIKSFAPVTQLAASQFVLVASPKFEASTVAELVALAKAKPGVLDYGSGGLGGSLHFLTEMLMRSTGISMTHIPYRGDGPMLTGLLAGDIQVAFMPQASAVAQLQSGQIKAFGVTGRKRSTSLPQVPTLLEAGVTGLEDGSWYGIFAPAGTPTDIVMTLQRAFAETLKAPEVIERIRANGSEPVGSTPAEFDVMYRDDVAKFARIIKEANIPRVE
jgi:tripartite-type tricarboxylate transporter receptor subunit TctC